MTNAATKLISLVRLQQVPHLMNWEDIKEGEIYHLPPLIFNKRMDFEVIKKENDTIKILKTGSDYPQTMFRTDITSRFIVKKLMFYGNKT